MASGDSCDASEGPRRAESGYATQGFLPPEIVGERACIISTGRKPGHSPLTGRAPRAWVFAQWVLEIFGEKLLLSGDVLDVAAGSGALAEKLQRLCSRKLLCTLVEPEPPERKSSETGLAWLEEHFNSRSFPCKHRELLLGCSVLLGFHPDEATEAIIDVSLRLKKPFAVVPCCVHTTLSSEQLLRKTGTTVKTYEEFLLHLQTKSSLIQTALLPCDGRNIVLYVL